MTTTKYSVATRTLLVDALPTNARSLVIVGLPDEMLVQQYKKRYPSTFFHCIVSEPTLAQAAHRYIDCVLVAQIEQMDGSFFRRFAMADGWLFNQNLEHLENKEKVLTLIQKNMAYDACILALVSNADNWRSIVSPDAVSSLTLHASLTLFEQCGLKLMSGIALVENGDHDPAEIKFLEQKYGVPANSLLSSHYLFKLFPV